MANWQERAEQERLRPTREREAAERAAREQQEAKEHEWKTQEPTILQRLGLFDQLQIGRILSEINRDLWDGKGTITNGQKQVHQGSGNISSALNAEVGFIFTKTEAVFKRVHVPERHHREVVYEVSVEYRTEPAHWEVQKVGERIVGIDEGTRSIASLGTGLYYYLDSDKYILTVAEKKINFDTPSADVTRLAEFVDRAFLEYAAMNLHLPDIIEANREEEQRKRSIIQANMGNLLEDVRKRYPNMSGLYNFLT